MSSLTQKLRQRARRVKAWGACAAVYPDAWRDIARDSRPIIPDLMSARAETLARQFETKADEATAVFERLSDTD